MLEEDRNKNRILTNSGYHVKNEVGEDNPSVTPSLIVTNVQRCKELIADLVLTILTRVRCVRVVKITSKGINEFASPLLTGLTTWWIENSKFVTLARNF